MEESYPDSDLDLPPDEEPAPTLFEAKDVARFDTALLPAVLCATSYAQNAWAFDIASGLADPAAWADEAIFKSDPEALARALMIAALCRPLSADELGLDPKQYGATFTRGVWRKGDLYQALCCVADGTDGAGELHLCIRGTDLGNNPSRWRSNFQTVLGYFIWTFPRIEKHAKPFKVLAEAMRSYADDPTHRVTKMVISGHSLGGAAAQTLFPIFAKSKLPKELYTFGSPGSGIGWLAPFRRLFRGLMRLITYFVEDSSATDLESMATHFLHPNDPIGRIGTMFYTRNGSTVQAMIDTEFEQELLNVRSRATSIRSHGVNRYVRSIASMIARAREDNSPWDDTPPSVTSIRRGDL